MPRGRVLSFMSQWGGPPKSPTTAEAPPTPTTPTTPSSVQRSAKQEKASANNITPPSSTAQLDQYARSSPTAYQRNRAESRASTRPLSMIQTYMPPMMAVEQDTPPELQPIFTYLNSHSNKLYQEGYFLKLHDLDSHGRPSGDRTWTECFAQLVGTVLSLWDAAQLDMAGEEAEVVPTFINVADASIKMIESLPMNGQNGQALQNVLSISTAASNRYLLHFNSLNSLTQWTAGIRLAMYEHTTLQEAYTGSLIAGKGKLLNNIRQIMERSRFPYEDWARVRFGAGTPWRRCWCVVTPPSEKEYQKLQKTIKKRSPYERSAPVLKGDVKFYESKKITKKTKPIATITDAYSAYAIYPQAKSFIDGSSLVKVEGSITVHTKPEATTEGFLFVLPEVHPAVSGFEMMLRWLFPVWDTFALYGRPNRLIADVRDSRGLMFAMPKNRRYGYLDILDIAALIHTEGSQHWTERQWRKQLKDLTSTRMAAATADDSPRASRRMTTSRTSLPPASNGTLRFDEGGVVRSQPPTRKGSPAPPGEFEGPRRTDSAPPGVMPFSTPRHQRSVSEAHGYAQYQTETPSRLAYGMSMAEDDESPPPPPIHRIGVNSGNSVSGAPTNEYQHGYGSAVQGVSNRESPVSHDPMPEVEALASASPPPAPVAAPPAFQHAPSQKPPTQPYQAPELRRANSAMDAATLSQLAEVNRKPVPQVIAAAGAAAAWRTNANGTRDDGMYSGEPSRRWEERDQRGVNTDASEEGTSTNQYSYPQGMVNSTSSRADNLRLPPIPASPYIGQDASPKVSYFEPAASTSSDQAEPVSPSPSPAASIVRRKPVASSLGEDPIASSSPSDLQDVIVDENALDRLPTHSSHNSDMQRSITPDYASTKSSESKQSVERPRMGVLKTVGTVEPQKDDTVVGDARYASGESQANRSDEKQPSASAALPDINFGPTYSLDPGAKGDPTTSGAVTASKNKDHLSADSPAKVSGNSTPSSEKRVVFELPEDVTNQRTGHSRTPSEQALRPHSESPSGQPSRSHSRSPSGLMPNAGSTGPVLWQPGSRIGSGGQPNEKSLPPEEWVEQRRIEASRPQPPPPKPRPARYRNSGSPASTPSHSRESSMNASPTGMPYYHLQQPRDGAGTPSPMSRNPSGDLPQLALQQIRARTPVPSRPTSAMGNRPPSRGANAIMAAAMPPQGFVQNLDEYQKHLSAQERMRVARATSSPLIQLTDSRPSHQRMPSTGLYGALEEREREKKAVKAGTSNVLVEQAIASHRREQQRETQAAQQKQMQQMQQVQQIQQAQLQAQQMAFQQQFPMQQPYQGQPMMYGVQQGGYPMPQMPQQQGFMQQPYGFGMPQPQQAFAPQMVQQQGSFPQQGQQQGGVYPQQFAGMQQQNMSGQGQRGQSPYGAQPPRT